uniref:Uncharacterized protein n=1 Tax=Manihot esculenta TaxID=3983 RepID=A0A2C9U192_MANES
MRFESRKADPLEYVGEKILLELLRSGFKGADKRETIIVEHSPSGSLEVQLAK